MYRPILIFVVVSSQQRMHQYRLRNGRIENCGQKAEGELKSYLTLVWMAPPPLPATIDWPELLALDYWFYWFDVTRPPWPPHLLIPFDALVAIASRPVRLLADVKHDSSCVVVPKGFSQIPITRPLPNDVGTPFRFRSPLLLVSLFLFFWNLTIS